MRDEKSAKKAKLRSLDKRLNKMFEDGKYNTPEYKKLNTEYMRTAESVHGLDQELGLEKRIAPLDAEAKEEILQDVGDVLKAQDEGFVELPSNPYAIWQAMKHLNDSLTGGRYRTYIISGVEYPITDPSGILMEASNFWRAIRTSLGGTPYVIISVNNSTGAIQYDPYETA